MTRQPGDVIVPANEMNRASLCVAIVSGAVAGLGVAVVARYAPVVNEASEAAVLLAAAVVGFVVAWLVCEHWFPRAHAYYGAYTTAHGTYNGLAVAAAVVMAWLTRRALQNVCH